MKWVTKQPTEPGYYWGMFKLKKEFPYPVIIQYCEYDIDGVKEPIQRKKEYWTMFDDKPTDINLFSHFIGPLKIPNFKAENYCITTQKKHYY